MGALVAIFSLGVLALEGWMFSWMWTWFVFPVTGILLPWSLSVGILLMISFAIFKLPEDLDSLDTDWEITFGKQLITFCVSVALFITAFLFQAIFL